MTSQLVPVKRPKYKLGDFLTDQHLVFLEVMAVIPEDNPVYGLLSPKGNGNDSLGWVTEWQAEKMGLTLGMPNFELWRNIAVGDSVYVEARRGAGHTHYVLSRVGDMVLLSADPKTRKQNQAQQQVEKQLQDLVKEMEEHLSDMPGMEITSNLIKVAAAANEQDEFDARLNDMITGSNAFKVAGDWMNVDTLARMNWQIGKE